MKETTIRKVLKYVEQYPGNKVHIFNGQMMYKEFQMKGFMKKEENYIPWNEAMCWGNADGDIFSINFVQKRIQSLNTTEQEYQKIVLEPLHIFMNKIEEGVVVCWFGLDMFCQMNLLTCLAYLEQRKYRGKVVCCLFDEENVDETLRIKEIELKTIVNCYKDIICRKKEIDTLPFVEMKQAMIDYLSLDSGDNEIVKYIKEHINEEKSVILHELMNKFKRFGLGDLQYLQIIDEILKK